MFGFVRDLIFKMFPYAEQEIRAMSSASGDDLFSRILTAFHEACFIRDLEVGRRLLQIAATFHFGRTDLKRRQQGRWSSSSNVLP